MHACPQAVSAMATSAITAQASVTRSAERSSGARTPRDMVGA
jgi:hypothetical protein